jgi:hypothetical protein
VTSPDAIAPTMKMLAQIEPPMPSSSMSSFVKLFKRADLDVRWNARTNALPDEVHEYHISPNLSP